MNKEHIINYLTASRDLKTQCLSDEKLLIAIEKAIKTMYQAVLNGGRIYACGNGGSAADAQHFAAELVGRFERERLELPALALTTDSSLITAISNDYSFNEIFAKQVKAFGQAGDVLLAITTSGNSANVLAAVEAAIERDMIVIGLTGKGGGKLNDMLQESSENHVVIDIVGNRTGHIQEMHITCIHLFCDGIDELLLQ